MQPFQREAQTARESGENALDTIKYGGAGAIGGGIAKAASKVIHPLISKVGAFLSPYLPEDIARKGISKVAPNIGKFVDQAMDGGADFEEVKNFIGEKISKGPKEEKNIIQSASPELHIFLDQEIKKGTNVLKAGALARLNKNFDKLITKMEKDHKAPWSSILENVYGSQQSKQGAQQQPAAQQAMQQPAPQQNAQQGPGASKLLDILNKRREARGA